MIFVFAWRTKLQSKCIYRVRWQDNFDISWRQSSWTRRTSPKSSRILQIFRVELDFQSLCDCLFFSLNYLLKTLYFSWCLFLSKKRCKLFDFAVQKGSAARHVGETKMNLCSSRSHCIFTVIVEMADVISQGTDSEQHIRFLFWNCSTVNMFLPGVAFLIRRTGGFNRH